MTEILPSFPYGFFGPYEIGLTLTDMVNFAEKVTPSSWIQCWAEADWKFGIFGIHKVRYDYRGDLDDLSIYLSDNSRGSIFHNYVAIGVMHQGIPIGSSGRLKRSRCRELRELCSCVASYVEAKRVEANRQQLEDEIQQLKDRDKKITDKIAEAREKYL